jgi:hypothetical protein
MPVHSIADTVLSDNDSLTPSLPSEANATGSPSPPASSWSLEANTAEPYTLPALEANATGPLTPPTSILTSNANATGSPSLLASSSEAKDQSVTATISGGKSEVRVAILTKSSHLLGQGDEKPIPIYKTIPTRNGTLYILHEGECCMPITNV